MNILYIHTHDSGRVLSPYGYKTVTPSIEAFSKDAVVMQNCFCASPTCSPSRAALLTGMYPHQNGMLGLAQRGFSLDYSKHLVQYLNELGFRTALCGIQHEAGWYLDVKDNGELIGYQEVLTADSEGYQQEELTAWDQENARRVCQWLDNRPAKEPFFLSYGMFATHRRYPEEVDDEIRVNSAVPPYPVPNTKENRRDFARYLTSLKSADTCFGMIIEALKKNKLYENTMIIFTTDHGLAVPFAKCSLFDSGIGVAMMVRLPGNKQNGSASDALVSQVDVFPTVCEVLGTKKPEYLAGTSFLDVLQGRAKEGRDEIFAEVTFHTSYEPIRCIRTKRYKYIRYYDKEYLKINKSNIDESSVKDFYMDNHLDQQVKYEEALYDLVYDPGERNNLVNEPEKETVLKNLRERLNRHLNKTNDAIRLGPIAVEAGWKVNKRECETASSKNPEDYVSIGR